MKLDRAPLMFPSADQFSAREQRKMHTLQQAFDSAAVNIRQLAYDQIKVHDLQHHRCFAELCHPLSGKMQDRAGGIRHARDAHAEFALFDRHRANFSVCSSSSDQFVTWLGKVNAQALSIESSGLRGALVRMNVDSAGDYIEFGPPELVPGRLEALRQAFLQSTFPRTFNAIAAIAILLNIHPFSDGNGRTARCLFNVLLNQDQATPSYLPLRTFFSASDGGFELRLREVEINGNWMSLVNYLMTICYSYEIDELAAN